MMGPVLRCIMWIGASLACSAAAMGFGSAMSPEINPSPMVLALPTSSELLPQNHRIYSDTDGEGDNDVGTPLLILAPLTEEQAASTVREISKSEPYVVRRSKVDFDTEQLLPWSAVTSNREVTGKSFQGRVLGVTLFPGHTFQLVVMSESHPGPAVVNLGLRLLGSELSTGTITINRESYILTIQDLGTATLYRVVGSTETGIGEVTEIDLLSLPPRYDATYEPGGRVAP